MSDERAATPMSDAEIDRFLREQGTGVLSLADGDDAYAVPVSFGYETGRALFGFYMFGETSRKESYAAATDRACLVVYEVAGRTDWRSVLAAGPLTEVPPESWDKVGASISDNAWTPDLSEMGDRRLPVTGYELTIEEATGRRATSRDS
ncbi:pyridoxamine 5'-phosphate oxidase family protein [Halosegnis sp.]|uniref:pyridoxamine 5'-phosphate oxidase family protein n=1 Tax=Halosegnis sp. TaxID=2864959 RepID=UPI0035D44DF0